MLTGDEANVTIEVKNNGPAIEKEILKQIFDSLSDNTETVFAVGLPRRNAEERA